MNYRKITSLVLVASFIYLIPVHFTSSVKEVVPNIINKAEAAAPATPTHLFIPNAKVNTNIVDVGITREGNLDVPGNYTEVGWYKFGARPGEIGSAVLDGHVDDGGKVPGPFKNLRNLKVGDRIYVTMSDGRVLNFKVKLAEVYPTTQWPGQKVFHETGDRYLKIITCHGKFVPKMGTYDQRLIVTAVLDL